MDSTVPSSTRAGAGLQSMQAATWSFPENVSPSAPATRFTSTSPLNALVAENLSRVENGAVTDDSSTQLPVHTDSPDADSVKDTATAIHSPPVTAVKHRKKTTTTTTKKKKKKKRKSPDSDGEYKSSTKEKKQKKNNNNTNATPAPNNSKRKTAADDLAESDYKPSKKFTRAYTLEDEIDDDPDLCLDECEEQDEQDMIHCDAEACRVGGKWFHTRCVGFGKVLPSNMDEFEWYCPTCRMELEVGQETDGLIYRTTLGAGVEKEPRRLRSSVGF